MRKKPKNYKPAKNKSIRPKPQNPSPKIPHAQIYGTHAVCAAIQNPDRNIRCVYVTDQGEQALAKRIPDNMLKNLNIVKMDKHALEKTLPKSAVHQGMALVCDALDEIGLEDLIIKTHNQARSLFVMLDQATDPHNIGAILRSACVFDLDGMILQRKHAPDLNGVLAKAACGGIEFLPVAYETNLSRSIETLKQHGYTVIGMDERGTAIDDLKARGVPEKLVIVLGAEGAGLRRLVKENCDVLIALPNPGPIDSLNVSNAAAVAFYALG